ncbi:hypothetical protein ACOKM5_27140 [Streptomyces sp. BH097]|uniref:hypothetical protein n=1 Tax=unclassified Streptomyces TaxID=2593676 RepID=UPI003BB8101B
MAGRGPAPKDPTKRRRRNATAPETVIVPDDELRGPELPAGVLGKEDGVIDTALVRHTL